MAAMSEVEPQSSSSTMMKTTKRGRPFLKDTMDLFATLIVSLQLGPHKQLFRTFAHSFTTDEAASNLASLKFSQSNRGPDPREASRVITTTTTTTFSMTRDMAKSMSQHFMDARLIENAVDPNANLFKDRGTYQLTPKGLHVLERFVSKNGINADHLQSVFTSQPICMRLLHLERRSTDDEIIVTQSVVTALFRRFAGREPNLVTPTPEKVPDAFQKYAERSKGISLSDATDRPPMGRAPQVHRFCFTAATALEWICDFTSIVGREEAAEMLAHFVRYGLITLVSDKRKNNDSAIIFTVRGPTPGGNSPISQLGEFRCTAKAVYKVTDEGARVAHWDADTTLNGSTIDLNGRASADHSVDSNDTKKPASELKLHRRVSMAERLNANYDSHDKKAAKESNTDRLRYILEDPALRTLFREFLRGNFCEENLSFWVDVQEFKKRFNITSTAMAVSPTGRPSGKPGQQAMEKHHELLVDKAFDIYNAYLAPSSPCELNIDHGLRNELVKYLEDAVNTHTGPVSGRIEPKEAYSFNATQLQTMIRLYERIQVHVFRLMATDSVPKFIKTEKFLAMRDWVEDFDPTESDIHMLTNGPSSPPGLGDSSDEVGGAYLTVSKQATEREHQQHLAEQAAIAANNPAT